MIEELKTVRDALDAIKSQAELLHGDRAKYNLYYIYAENGLSTLDRIIAEQTPDASKMVVPICFRSLVKYAEWQMNEGANYHPTLPSCVAECKAMLSAAPQPQPIDVEKLRMKLQHSTYEPATHEEINYVRGYNDAIDHISANYNITKKGE